MEPINLISVPGVDADEEDQQGFVMGLCEAMNLDSILLLGITPEDENGHKHVFCGGWASNKDNAVMIDSFFEKHPEIPRLLAHAALTKMIGDQKCP